jgi:hypothetical protein
MRGASVGDSAEARTAVTALLREEAKIMKTEGTSRGMMYTQTWRHKHTLPYTTMKLMAEVTVGTVLDMLLRVMYWTRDCR